MQPLVGVVTGLHHARQPLLALHVDRLGDRANVTEIELEKVGINGWHISLTRGVFGITFRLGFSLSASFDFVVVFFRCFDDFFVRRVVFAQAPTC